MQSSSGRINGWIRNLHCSPQWLFSTPPWWILQLLCQERPCDTWLYNGVHHSLGTCIQPVVALVAPVLGEPFPVTEPETEPVTSIVFCLLLASILRSIQLESHMIQSILENPEPTLKQRGKIENDWWHWETTWTSHSCMYTVYIYGHTRECYCYD